jgi:branched-chain amino acid transport system permease protein
VIVQSAVSGDMPRSRILGYLITAILLTLAFTPLIFSGSQPINTAAKICIFIVLVASYDLLIGYTGIVSFAHTMFFGIGGYGVGLALYGWGPTWISAGLGLAIALIVGTVLAFVIGLLSLRVRAIFYAMITLAVASAFAILAGQLSEYTGGEDGRSFRVPPLLRPGTVLFDIPALGVSVNGRVLSYYVVYVSALLLLLAAFRIVNSPFGRVLQAIRENDFRAEAIGYRTVVYRTIASVASALFATLAGVLLALWLRYNGPDTTLSFEIMLDVLLIVVIGGMGTIYGAVVGSVLLVLAQNYLQDLMKVGAESVQNIPVVSQIVSPDRWLLWLGILFVLSVYYFPNGVVGRLRALRRPPPAP